MFRVKHLCKQKGITLKELATRIDVSAEAVTRMLKEDGNPKLSNLKKIATVLDVRLSELFDDFDEDMTVRGYLEVGDKTHRINNFNDLETVYNELKRMDS